MTNKIIEAARLAGGTTYTNRHHNGTACAFGPEALARFYALARAEALEDAAKVCDQYANNKHSNLSDLCAEAIRALKEQAAAIAAGKGEA